MERIRIMQATLHSILPKTLIVLVGTLIGASQALALSPPWIVFQNEAKASLGADSCVHVDDLDLIATNTYNLDIHVLCDNDKAGDLSKFATRTAIVGGAAINIRVIDQFHHVVPATPISTNVRRAGEELANALSTNFFFLDILPPKFPVDVSAEFCMGVVQFFADNIGDFYRNENVVAAQAFEDVLDLARFSTPVSFGESTSETTLCAGSGTGK